MTDSCPVPIAGPVFTEDDRPTRLIFYGLPIAAIAGGLYLAGRLTRLTRVTRAAAALALAPAIVLGSVAVYATVEHRRTEAADARAVTFATFAAPDLHQTHADVFPGSNPELNLRYERRGGELSVSQVVAEDDDLTPPQCQAHDGTPFHAWYGPCRSARTPRGRVVAVVETQIGVAGFLDVRDGTLIVASARAPAREADLLALADALRPIDVDEIHWER